jgi:hypothetical protein
MLDWARRHQWTTTVVDDHSDTVTEMIVILRDPLDRWVSGIVQYINTYILSVQGPNGPVFPDEPYSPYNWPMDAVQWIDGYNQTTERLIFDQINRFDDHVWPQHEFFENLLPTVPRKYFWLDKDFDHNISCYLNFTRLNSLDKNVGKDNKNMHILQQFFKQRFVVRPELAERVKKSYAADYQLIKQVFNQ